MLFIMSMTPPGSRVVDVSGPRNHLVHRANTDDFAGSARDLFSDALAFEVSYRLARAKELAAEVNPYHLVPLFHRHLIERRIPLDTGVIDDDVHLAELLFHSGEHRQDLILLADVGLKDKGAAATALNFCDDIVSLGSISPAVDNHVRSRFPQRNGNRPTDS
jgi:hypothetical protein